MTSNRSRIYERNHFLSKTTSYSCNDGGDHIHALGRLWKARHFAIAAESGNRLWLTIAIQPQLSNRAAV